MAWRWFWSIGPIGLHLFILYLFIVLLLTHGEAKTEGSKNKKSNNIITENVDKTSSTGPSHGILDISANDPNESLVNLNDRYNIPNEQKPNFLIILADDLGHGDTSVKPFVGSGIKTPNLEHMAAGGLVMTNFHSAAATCTPTRVSILTGMNPWRLGLKVAYDFIV